MHKRGIILLGLVVLAIAAFSTIANADDPFLTCYFRNASTCFAGDTKLVGASNYTNAHAEIPNPIPDESYGWSICCKTVVGNTLTAGFTGTCDDSNFYNITGLNDSTGTGVSNAHVEVPNFVGITSANMACLNANIRNVICQNPTPINMNPWDVAIEQAYGLTALGESVFMIQGEPNLFNHSCPTDKTCLFTQSNVTNGHIGNCSETALGGDPYGWRKCCAICPPGTGDLGDPCCGGSCLTGYVCVGNTCLLVQRSGINATIWGYVRDIYTNPIVGARVEAFNDIVATTKNYSITNSNGYYELKFGNVSGSPFDLVASAGGYDPSPYADYSLFPGVSVQQNFQLAVLAGNCNDDCTSLGSNLCSATCDGRGDCRFYDATTMALCDGKPVTSVVRYGNQLVNCCEGSPYTPMPAKFEVDAKHVARVVKIVQLPDGRLGKMVIYTFI